MSAKEIVLAVHESALKTPVTSPTLGTDSNYARLTDGFFNMMAVPIGEKVPYGGGIATAAMYISDHYECKGQLKMKLYPSQAAFWLGWAGQLFNGTSTPYATTEPTGDLCSMTFYHGIRRSDGTFKRTGFGGSKCAGFTLEASRRSPVWMLTLDIVACNSFGNQMESTSDPTSTPFPFPASETNYPLSPFTFAQSSGGLTVGSTRTQYDSLKITVKNTLDPRWFEAPSLSVLQFTGREVTLEADLLLKASPDDQSSLESLAAQSVSLVLTQSTHSVTMDMKSNNVVTGAAYDLPNNQAFMRKLTVTNLFDESNSTDFTLAFT